MKWPWVRVGRGGHLQGAEKQTGLPVDVAPGLHNDRDEVTLVSVPAVVRVPDDLADVVQGLLGVTLARRGAEGAGWEGGGSGRGVVVVGVSDLV